jgi:hypothetical protein
MEQTSITKRFFATVRGEGAEFLKPTELRPGFRLIAGMLPKPVQSIIDNLVVKPGDVFVATYPKCGTTWMQQIVKLIMNDGKESGRDVDDVFPWLEIMTNDDADVLQSPRTFKTHLPYHLMPGGLPSVNKQAKYINVYRNPKDTAVSLYHHSIGLKYGNISWDDFYEKFISGQTICGSYFDTTLEWWSHKDEDNVLVMSYEEMKRNPHVAIETVSSFLGYKLSDDVVSSIVEQTIFDRMKVNPAANYQWMEKYRQPDASSFMRKGEIGDWKNYFSKEQSAGVDELITHKFHETNLIFDFGNDK